MHAYADILCTLMVLIYTLGIATFTFLNDLYFSFTPATAAELDERGVRNKQVT